MLSFLKIVIFIYSLNLKELKYKRKDMKHITTYLDIEQFKKGTLIAIIMFTFGAFGFAQNNIAPQATISANGSNGGGCIGPCNSLNDLIINNCGVQEMYIRTSTPPSTTAGDDYIEWSFPSVHAFDSLIIHHGEHNNRSLTGATIQYWNGASWVTHGSFDSLPQQCVSRISIGKLETDRFRLTLLEMTGSGQASNPNFREIEIIEVATAANNAAVTRLDSPASFCGSSAQDIWVNIRNVGINTIDSLDVFWEIDGVAQGSKTIIGKLDTITGVNPSDTTIRLGNYSFSTLSEVKIYTSMPNGVVDTVNYNDTLITIVGPGLSGNYTVNPAQLASATNFTSLDSMTSILNTVGVCGPTQIIVSNGVYNSPLYLGDIPGASATNHILIDGIDSSQTIISHDGSKKFATLTFDGTKHTRVQNFTFEMTGSENSAVIFSGEASFDTLSNSSTWLDINLTADHWNIAFSSSPNAIESNVKANHILIQNNRIIGGKGGITSTAGMMDVSTLIQVYNNEIDSTYEYGLLMYFQDSLEVVGNSINMLSRGNPDASGIVSFFGNNAIYNENFIWAGNLGIHVYNFPFQTLTPVSRRFGVVNNMIYTKHNHALYLQYVDSLDLIHNSINAESKTASAVSIFAGAIGPVSGYDVRNNIFKSDRAEAFESTEPDSIFNKFDHNIFFNQSGDLMRIGNTAYADLAAYQLAIPNKNMASLEGDPQFFSNLDLHIAGLLPNEAGDTTVGIRIDIDGDVRPSMGATYVDIGADEYTPPTCPAPQTAISAVKQTSAIAYFTPKSLGNTMQYVLVSCGEDKYTGNLMTTTADSVLLTGLRAAKCYEFYIREECSRGDTSVWAGPYRFNTLIQEPLGVNCITGGADVVFEEEFDALAANGWIGDIGTGSSNGMWNVNSGGTTTSGTGPNAAHSGKNYIYVETSGKANSTVNIVSPLIDLTSVLDSAELSFWLHAFGNDIGTLEVGLSESVNGPFKNVFIWSGALQAQQADPYQQVGIRLDSLIGDSLYVEFSYHYGNTGEGDIAIDLMEVTACVNCPKPDSMYFSNLQLTSVELNWREKGAATQWEYSYGIVDSSSSQRLTDTTMVTTAQLNNLTKGTAYEFYVRSICGIGDSSAWAGPFYFRTPYSVPFFEDFETFGRTIRNPWPKGWSSTTTSNPKWESTSGTTTTSNTGPEVDHTVGTSSGTYVFLETSGGSNGDSADFVSPQIVVGSSQETLKLSFWYHFFGATVNGIDVIVDVDGVETIVDTIYNQRQMASSDPWEKDSVTLTAYQGKTITIKFRGKRGSSYTGDIAIDDVAIEDIGAIVGIDKQESSNGGLTFYPNPTTGSFTIATSGLENDNAMITIRDISGKVIVRENIINSSSAFKKHYSLEGQAKGLYLISIIDGEKRINKKLILQ